MTPKTLQEYMRKQPGFWLGRFSTTVHLAIWHLKKGRPEEAEKALQETSEEYAEQEVAEERHAHCFLYGRCDCGALPDPAYGEPEDGGADR